MPPKRRDEKKEEEDARPMEDNGTFVFEDGARFSGQFTRRDGTVKRQGQGKYTSDALTFEGGWKDDQMHGQASVVFASGATFVGNVDENVFDGRGTYTWPDGARYEGQWRYNRMHGEGVYTDATGTVWSGRFYNGTGPGLRQVPPPQALGANIV